MKRFVRVNSKGQKVTRIKCDSGQKFNGSTCVQMTASEISNRRKAGRRAAMKRKSTGGYAKSVKKSSLARKRREMMGL